MKLLAALLPILLLCGCASMSTIKTVDALDPDDLRAIDPMILAGDYAVYRKDAEAASGKSRLALELENRFYYLASSEAVRTLEEVLLEKGLTEAELESARKGEIFIGMSELGLYAAWGRPLRSNRSTTLYLTRTQHVFGDFGPYAYTSNGIVVSWQN